jgi:hypothetical protein
MTTSERVFSRLGALTHHEWEVFIADLSSRRGINSHAYWVLVEYDIPTFEWDAIIEMARKVEAASRSMHKLYRLGRKTCVLGDTYGHGFRVGHVDEVMFATLKILGMI